MYLSRWALHTAREILLWFFVVVEVFVVSGPSWDPKTVEPRNKKLYSRRLLSVSLTSNAKKPISNRGYDTNMMMRLQLRDVNWSNDYSLKMSSDSKASATRSFYIEKPLFKCNGPPVECLQCQYLTSMMRSFGSSLVLMKDEWAGCEVLLFAVRNIYLRREQKM